MAPYWSERTTSKARTTGSQNKRDYQITLDVAAPIYGNGPIDATMLPASTANGDQIFGAYDILIIFHYFFSRLARLPFGAKFFGAPIVLAH